MNPQDHEVFIAYLAMFLLSLPFALDVIVNKIIHKI